MGSAQLDTPAHRWFPRRTWHHTDFDVASLVQARDATVSVVIPALDEAGTIADVVRTSTGLVQAGLVDEVIVVDGGSRDGTPRIASTAGASVIDQHEVMPHAGPGKGKGDALWKGVALSEGDIVVFVDADLRDADERYVVGLLGPLLTEPGVGFVKACYDRPLDLGPERQPRGGGRVTELTARPLLACFWPELCGVAQPLSGEYAGRRSVLEQVPFVQGWGVEFALLVDIADRFGVDAIGQVDLGARLHSHQPLAALGRMAAEILRVAAARLSTEGRLTGEVGDLLLQTERDATGRLRLERTQLGVRERPPLRA